MNSAKDQLMLQYLMFITDERHICTCVERTHVHCRHINNFLKSEHSKK